MFESLRTFLVKALRIAAMERELGETRALVSTLTQKFADLELHNAGMHASLHNMLLKNEALLQDLNRKLADQGAILKRSNPEKSAEQEINSAHLSPQAYSPSAVPKPGSASQ